MSDRMQQLKSEYQAIPVPRTLSATVNALCERHRPRAAAWRWALAGVAAALALFVGTVNALPAQAATLANVPVLGPLVRVLTFVDYTANENGYQANIRIARVEGLDNQDLEDAINAELLANGQALIDKYQADVADLQATYGEDSIRMGVETYYEIMASNAEVFSLRVEYFFVAGGSDTSFDFYNVNQKTGQLITLDSLFQPGSDYLTVINNYLIEQMAVQTDETGHSLFWVGNVDSTIEPFTGITADHNFYINQQGKLVIAFDKYEVAAGYVGTPEFEIPTELIAGMLADGAPIH